MFYVRLFSTAFAVSTGQLIIGLYSSWCSPYLPHLAKKNMSLNDLTWIASIWKLGSICGSVIALLAIDLVGRKSIMLACLIPNIFSWTYMSTATYFWDYLIARFIGGILDGVFLMAGPTYIAECSPPDKKSILNNSFLFTLFIGNILGYVMGSFCTMQQYSHIAVAISMLQFIFLIFIPETPYHLIRRKRHLEARSALKFLRNTKKVSEEMDSIMKTIESLPKDEGILRPLSHFLENRGSMKIFFITIGLMTAHGSTGTLALQCFAQTTFDAIDNVFLDGVYLSIVFIVIDTCGHIVYYMIIDKIDQKSLCIVSEMGSIVFAFLVGSCLFISSRHNIVISGWVPITGIFFYVFFTALGITNIAIVVLQQIFPMYSKSVFINLCHIINSILIFSTVKLWGLVIDIAGIYAAFWMLVILNAFSIPFLIIFIPELHKILSTQTHLIRADLMRIAANRNNPLPGVRYM